MVEENLLESNVCTPKAPSAFSSLKWHGAKPFQLLSVCLLGLFLWNCPVPDGLDVKTWHLFSIFVATIVAVIIKPLPMGAVSIVAASVCLCTKTLTLPQTLNSFSSQVVWLVVFAFFIARGFIKTGLGSRVAYTLIKYLGHNSLGLAYGLVLTDLFLAPVVPSNTARGAGVLFPIVQSLASDAGDDGDQQDNKRGRTLGGFLIKVCFHANVITSAMFLTSLAGNPLIASFANELGADIDWMTWACAAIVPGVVNLFFMPLLIFKLYKPEFDDPGKITELARIKLNEMGRLSFNECLMLIAFSGLLVLWVFGKQFGVDATTAAMLGVTVLLVTGVLNWNDVIQEKGAWATLIWFTILLMMATNLTEFGMIAWFSDRMQSLVQGFHWVTALTILALVYFYTHYFFASITAHITAMYSAFLIVCIAAGAPIMLAAMGMAVLSSLSGALTHYGTGTAPVYFGAGYYSVAKWWKIGAIVGLMNLVIWLSVGLFWWKVIGLW